MADTFIFRHGKQATQINCEEKIMDIKDYAIKGFKLLMYWCWWMLSATSTVTSCVIPARSKSA